MKKVNLFGIICTAFTLGLVSFATINNNKIEETHAAGGADSDEGLYTTIVVKDTAGWAFRTLWLDNFEYADGYNQNQRNLFIQEHYQNEISNWDPNGYSGRGYHYWSGGVNLATGEDGKTCTFQLPAWIINCTIEVQDSGNTRYIRTLDNLAEKSGGSDPIGEAGNGVGKTINVECKTDQGLTAGAFVEVSDNKSYSNTVTMNRYFLKSDGSVKATDQVTRHQYYLAKVDKVAVDGYATNNKWYLGTTYAASDVFNSANILTSSDAVNLVAKYELGSNDSTLEIRFTRPNDWENNAIAMHTWNDGGSGTTFPGYLMTWLWNNNYGEGIFSWSPSFDEPLYGNIIFNTNNNWRQTPTLTTPSTSKWYYGGDWHDVPTMDIYLYDYDNVFNGNVNVHAWRNGTSFQNDTKPGLPATQLIDIATNGLIYKFTMNNRYDRVIFSNNGINPTGELTPIGNYCYVLANDIEGKNTWWGDINYVFAHNFSQHTMLMDTIPTSDRSVTPYCTERYDEAKKHFTALMNSGYGPYVLTKLNEHFTDAMERFAAWASANGEGIDTTNGNVYTISDIQISSDVYNIMIIFIVISASLAAIGGFFLLRRKRR